ncbi:MAG: translation initiation factor IF-2 subunit alpha [Candidatus Methanomethylicaceae archaeon]|nr:translation initiation factor IF-2 subunit alpha [Candidatus Verstraetearchaeota archaeon]
MGLRKREYPEIGEFVIGTAVKIQDHGAYVNLDEFNKTGYIPIGEIASTWVKNIRDYIKEGQKVVLKVIRVDEKKGHIDLSLKKVTEREKKEKLIQWKRTKRAEKILEEVASSLKKDFSEAVEKVGIPLEDQFGDLYTAMEAAVAEGYQALVDAGIPETWAKAIQDAAKEHIEPPMVQVTGVLQLNSTKPKGIEDIKRALLEGEERARNKGGKLEITYLGAPRYRIEVTAKDYRTAEEILKETAETIIERLAEVGGSGTFTR